MAQLRLIYSRVHFNFNYHRIRNLRIRYLRLKLGMLGILMILVFMATYHSVP